MDIIDIIDLNEDVDESCSVHTGLEETPLPAVVSSKTEIFTDGADPSATAP